ncbi:MAG: hypothetical protein EZS28_023732 [Streblomastix strix]|uniref:Uncharacterized protein n=1 Tax=Streblomastix strix TaxID=222440 RepID=A0A5J4VE54_9EUKA|nr:MAG: hypothetical protein EZS28_023732 [Streblomastix strix]
MIVAILLLVLLNLNVRCQNVRNYSNKSESNEVVDYYVSENGYDYIFCGLMQNPCSTLVVLLEMIRNGEYYIHVYEGTYLLPLSIFTYYHENKQNPNIDIIAEEKAQINITGQQNPIGKIQLSFSKFSIDFADLYFQIDEDGSLLKFTDCILFRNGGKQAVNAYSLAVVNYGSLILENLNIHGNNLEGNEPLIQATSPKLIHFTSLTVTNLSLVSGNTAPLLLSVTELPQESKIVISDIHAKQNTVGNQAETGIIFIHASSPMNNEDSSTQPILLVENSEITQNTLAPIQDACSIQLEGLNPQQILIKNSTIINRSPTNNNKQYEFKIVLPSDSILQDLINQFQTVDFGFTINPVAVKLLPNEQFNALVLPLSDEYANITVKSNGQESCTSYVANYYQDVKSVGCAVIIIRAQDNLGLFRGIQRLISITGNLTENDLHTDGLTVSFKGTNA